MGSHSLLGLLGARVEAGGWQRSYREEEEGIKEEARGERTWLQRAEMRSVFCISWLAAEGTLLQAGCPPSP